MATTAGLFDRVRPIRRRLKLEIGNVTPWHSHHCWLIRQGKADLKAPKALDRQCTTMASSPLLVYETGKGRPWSVSYSYPCESSVLCVSQYNSDTARSTFTLSRRITQSVPSSSCPFEELPYATSFNPRHISYPSFRAFVPFISLHLDCFSTCSSPLLHHRSWILLSEPGTSTATQLPSM